MFYLLVKFHAHWAHISRELTLQSLGICEKCILEKKRLEVFGTLRIVYIRAFPICVCDPITFNQLLGYIIIFSVVFRDTPQRNTCCNNSLGKTAARPIYLCGWLPWKALQEVGGKVVAKEGEGEEGEEKKEDCNTNRLVTRVPGVLLLVFLLQKYVLSRI